MANLITRDPAAIHPAFSNYALGAEVAEPARWLHISGQVGVDRSGKLAYGAEAQMVQAFANIGEILKDAGMSKENLVKITVYLTRQDDAPLYRDVRDQVLTGHRCASTLLVISGLANPDWLVEIEAVAAA